ncbi:MAG: hypothetical protein MR696_06355, partial [Lachnospiraceae bacterium]|nr:hypothetical protein [Lachnospiraceae bacterium]
EVLRMTKRLLTAAELSGEVMKMAGKKIREIPTVIPEDEFQKYLEDVQDQIYIWKNDGLGYISIKCQLSDMLCGIKDEDMVFTVGQIKRIFSLVRN